MSTVLCRRSRRSVITWQGRGSRLRTRFEGTLLAEDRGDPRPLASSPPLPRLSLPSGVTDPLGPGHWRDSEPGVWTLPTVLVRHCTPGGRVNRGPICVLDYLFI